MTPSNLSIKYDIRYNLETLANNFPNFYKCTNNPTINNKTLLVFGTNQASATYKKHVY